MYKDKYADYSEIDLLFKEKVNFNQYFTIDLNYMAYVDLFVKRQYIEG